jgi:aspartyl protease family protein
MSTRLAWGHVAALAIWIAISGGAYLYFDARQKPTIVTARADLAGGQVVIPRSRDGHYYIRGAIHGQPVDFMVDTGASIVSVSRAVARKANLPAGIASNFSTAGGTVTGEVVAAQSVEAGGIVVEGISVGVGIHGDIGLLGQNFLRNVDVLQLEDKMLLRIRVK